MRHAARLSVKARGALATRRASVAEGLRAARRSAYNQGAHPLTTHTMSYLTSQAARLADLHPDYLVALLRRAEVPSTLDVRGRRVWDAVRFDAWLAERRGRTYDRAANFGVYRRRARGDSGCQVCPGTTTDCGAQLGRTPTGRLARLCPDCRRVADQLKARRRWMRRG
jgi:hypothetical protein